MAIADDARAGGRFPATCNDAENSAKGRPEQVASFGIVYADMPINASFGIVQVIE